MAGLFRSTGTLKARGIALLAALVVVVALPEFGPYAQRHRDLLTFAIGGLVFVIVFVLEKRSKGRRRSSSGKKPKPLVMPAQAGIHGGADSGLDVDSRLRGSDEREERW